jgi:UDP-N-acetylmuramoylalanine--D-glutamate ligase
MRDWTGHLLVLGLGESGQAVCEWALGRAEDGADVRVTVVDSGTGPSLEPRAAALRARGAAVVLGSDELPQADLVVPSPGIKPSSALYRAAVSLGVPMLSEIEIAYRISDAPWIAITGTNGKTTTTALVTHLLREAGFAAEPAGNFGPAAVRVVAETGRAGAVVAEVSSFQLMLADEFHPRVSVLLNITPDHLDYHGTMQAYAGAKARVFARQTAADTAVIDVDDAGSAPYAATVAAAGVEVRSVSRSGTPEEGAFVRDGVLMLVHDNTPIELVRIDELKIKGHHNVSNALAAAAAAHAFGADPGALRSGLVTFEPIEHRLEPAGAVGGVEYFNDSKATNPDAVMKALTAFEDRPVVLLLGGRNKGIDMRPLALAVDASCKAAVLFGEAAPELAEAFDGTRVPVRVARDLASAVVTAQALAAPGDAVLLSPACTSWDEFDDYTQRGRRFKSLVESLEEAE